MKMGELIREERINKGLTQRRLVELLYPDVQVSQNRLSNVERGERQILAVELVKVREILDISWYRTIDCLKHEMPYITENKKYTIKSRKVTEIVDKIQRLQLRLKELNKDNA
jgi:transcriptional regulator with XRE-family HTH domain